VAIGLAGVIIISDTFRLYLMIKNAVILILLVLLGISSYLLLEARFPELMFWAKNYNKGINDSIEQGGNMEDTIETLGPTPTPEMSAEPTVRLTLGPSRTANERADSREIYLQYQLIRPSFLEVLDSTGNTAAEVNLETGETVFGKDYNPNEASKEFWKSLAKNYPEVCVLKQNRE
jgi:hypothetical protein